MPSKGVLLKITESELEYIDAVRGDVPRTVWIMECVRERLPSPEEDDDLRDLAHAALVGVPAETPPEAVEGAVVQAAVSNLDRAVRIRDQWAQASKLASEKQRRKP